MRPGAMITAGIGGVIAIIIALVTYPILQSAADTLYLEYVNHCKIGNESFTRVYVDDGGKPDYAAASIAVQANGSNCELASTPASTDILYSEHGEKVGGNQDTSTFSVDDLDITEAGSGYLDVPDITFNAAPTGGTDAAATATMGLVTGGPYYDKPQLFDADIDNGDDCEVTFMTPTSGTAATGTCSVNKPTATSKHQAVVTITAAGSGYIEYKRGDGSCGDYASGTNSWACFGPDATDRIEVIYDTNGDGSFTSVDTDFNLPYSFAAETDFDLWTNTFSFKAVATSLTNAGSDYLSTPTATFAAAPSGGRTATATVNASIDATVTAVVLDSNNEWKEPYAVLAQYGGISTLVLSILPILSVTGFLGMSAANLYKYTRGDAGSIQGIVTQTIGTLLVVIIGLYLAPTIFQFLQDAFAVSEGNRFTIMGRFNTIIVLVFSFVPVIFCAGLLVMFGQQGMSAYKTFASGSKSQMM